MISRPDPAADSGLPGPRSIARVLVVDDSRLQRRILVSVLRRMGLRTIEAADGQSALEICATDPPDLVISDWVMPGMSGPDFARAFRALPREGYGYFILLTSKSEKVEIAHGLDAGADDFLTKPVNPGELRARIAAGDRIVAMQRQLSEKNQVITETLSRLQTAYEKIDQDLIQAKNIQKSLVPERSRAFGASRISLLLKPCGHIGGDLVGMFSPGLNRVGFYCIDVSGHGITSAMMTARLGGYLSGNHFNENVAMIQKQYEFYGLRPPREVAERLNARLMEDTGIEEYFTMVYAMADLDSGLVQMVQCGHPHPLILRRGGYREYLGQGGPPIGLLPDLAFEQFEVQLHHGDRLLLYSDGFTECRLQGGAMLEPEGLIDLVAQSDHGQQGSEFLDDLFWNLTAIMDTEAGLEDDVSAALLEFRRA
ncbi:MAG TPA: fused response regulator/phosphatase [Rhodobacteraceae bacterium]|nr:fused response regulator/phosphatase [Paracoccaceae bacterium]